MPEAVVTVEHVRKDFVLPHEKHNSLKSVFTGLFKKKDKEKDVQHALKDVSFSIRKGEFFGIVGRNGSGKSTMLKMLAGIYQPTSGMIQTRGRLVSLIELGVGFNPELSGRENVYLNGAILGYSTKQTAQNYKKIVEFSGLEEFMDQKLKNYSSGMQVRLAFACATMAEADILIVDEVLAVGDADFQKKCFKYFKELKNSGKTVVLVTHDMNSVREYCDHAILIDNGLIVDEGDIESVTRSYQELFNPLSHSDATVSRWGDKRATINKASAAAKDGQVTIHGKATFHQEIVNEEILVAYAVKNDIGQKLFGNKIASDQLAGIKKGASYSFSFTFPDILSEGLYFVDLSLFSEKSGDFLECWIDCAEFRTVRNATKGYPIVIEDTFSEELKA